MSVAARARTPLALHWATTAPPSKGLGAANLLIVACDTRDPGLVGPKLSDLGPLLTTAATIVAAASLSVSFISENFRPAILIRVSGGEREDDAKLIEGD